MARSGRFNVSWWLGWLSVFGGVCATQFMVVPECGSDDAPNWHDAMEVFDIGWCLSHGHGYAFDWDEPDFRRHWDRQNQDGSLDHLMAHHGGPHLTLFRPPLMPLMVAGILRAAPARPFLAWRLVDTALFGTAAALLVSATRRRFGGWPATVVLALLLADPLRIQHVPGWWTEGLAFDGVAVTCCLVLIGRAASARWAAVVGGVTLGLLCLDRPVFLVSLLIWSVVVAMAVVGRGRRRWWTAVGVLTLAVILQVPWWARNIAVAGRFLPLGTQGGANLPDEYSDWAVDHRGFWADGLAMAQVWLAQPTTPAVRALQAHPAVWALFPNQPRFAALLHAETCESTATEIAVADAGQRAGLAWIRSHPRQLPGLFVAKIWTETTEHRPWTLLLVAAGGVGLALAGKHRRTLLLLLALVVAYAAGIGLTHSVRGRFLVPILPALYVPAAVGLVEAARRFDRRRDRRVSPRFPV